MGRYRSGLCGATQAIFAIAFALSSGSIIYTWLKTKNVKALGQYVLGAVLSFGLTHLYMYWVIQYSSGFVWEIGHLGQMLFITLVVGTTYKTSMHGAMFYKTPFWLSWFSAFGGLTWFILSFISMLRQKLSLLNFWWLCLFRQQVFSHSLTRLIGLKFLTFQPIYYHAFRYLYLYDPL